MKIRVESSATSGDNLTGVGYYTQQLTQALIRLKEVEIHTAQFNFLARQNKPNIDGPQISESINFPQKVYAKMAMVNIAFPFDTMLQPVDVTIFPNFALWPTKKSKIRVATIHDLTFLHYPEVVEDKNLAYLKKVVPKAITDADLILTVSQSVKNELIDEFGLDAARIFVTPIPPMPKFSVSSNQHIRNRYKIPTDKYLLFGGTIEPRKNVETLLDAYLLLPEPVKQTYSLVLAGGMGWKSERIKMKLAEAQEKYQNIILTGYYDKEDAAALYQQAELYIMPSLYEGFGMPLLEAMASGTPTIASDIPVLREVCGDASLYFKLDDSRSLTAQILSVINSESLQSELVKKGFINLERYSWEKVALSLYERILQIL